MAEISIRKVVTEPVVRRVEGPPKERPEAGPLGMFDSGMGGLTVLKEVIKHMPHEDVIYFADSVHVPYGSRSAADILRFNTQIIGHLEKLGVKAVIMACGTSSNLAFNNMKRKFKLPIFSLIEPAAKAARKATRNYKVGVIATEAAIKAQGFQIAIRRMERGMQVFAQACPMFVPLVEGDFIGAPETKEIAKEYLKPLAEAKIDTLVLGCTHYPHLSPVLREILGPKVTLVDPAAEVVAEVRQSLEKAGMLKEVPKPPRYQFLVSGSPMRFKEVGSKLLGRPITDVREERL